VQGTPVLGLLAAVLQPIETADLPWAPQRWKEGRQGRCPRHHSNCACCAPCCVWPGSPVASCGPRFRSLLLHRGVALLGHRPSPSGTLAPLAPAALACCPSRRLLLRLIQHRALRHHSFPTTRAAARMARLGSGASALASPLLVACLLAVRRVGGASTGVLVSSIPKLDTQTDTHLVVARVDGELAGLSVCHEPFSPPLSNLAGACPRELRGSTLQPGNPASSVQGSGGCCRQRRARLHLQVRAPPPRAANPAAAQPPLSQALLSFFVLCSAISPRHAWRPC
jgi:hypothetical protein